MRTLAIRWTAQAVTAPGQILVRERTSGEMVGEGQARADVDAEEPQHD
jgi:hypothetical protein